MSHATESNKRLWDIRWQLDITQSEFARLVEIERSYLSLLETGKRRVSARILQRAEKLLAAHIPRSEIVEHLRGHIACLKESFKDHMTGQIIEPHILREIACFEEAIKLIYRA